MGINMTEIGKMTREKAKEFSLAQKALNIKENGKEIKEMEKENSLSKMEKLMKVNS
jgi:hypothetical protein